MVPSASPRGFTGATAAANTLPETSHTKLAARPQQPRTVLVPMKLPALQATYMAPRSTCRAGLSPSAACPWDPGGTVVALAPRLVHVAAPRPGLLGKELPGTVNLQAVGGTGVFTALGGMPSTSTAGPRAYL